MKIVDFFKKHSRYHKLLDDYNILTEKYNQQCSESKTLEDTIQQLKNEIETIQHEKDECESNMNNCMNDNQQLKNEIEKYGWPPKEIEE